MKLTAQEAKELSMKNVPSSEQILKEIQEDIQKCTKYGHFSTSYLCKQIRLDDVLQILRKLGYTVHIGDTMPEWSNLNISWG